MNGKNKKDIFDRLSELDVFDRLSESDIFDRLKLTPEEKIIFSKEMLELLSDEINTTIASLPIGSLVTKSIESQIEKLRPSLKVDTSQIKEEIDGVASAIKKELVQTNQEVEQKFSALQKEIKAKYLELTNNFINNGKIYTFGGFAPPNPMGHSGEFLTNSGTWDTIAWAPVSGGSLHIGDAVTGGTQGSLLAINPTGILAQIADVATGNALISGGVGVIPSYGKIGLTTHVSGVLPVANGGSGSSTQFTAGSVIFAGASGVYSQDNANFFWDDTNNRLGIGTATPTQRLTIEDSFLSLNKGTNNCVVGKSSGAGLTGSTNTTLLGVNIGGSNTIAGHTVVVGAAAVPNGVSDFNVVVGAGAGSSIGANTQCTLIGYNTNISSSGSIANATAIGSGAVASHPNTMILGSGVVDVGIGISDPRVRLEIADSADLGTEAITNGDFTTDTSGWTGDGATLAVIASGMFGDNCLEITNTSEPGLATQTFPTNPRQRYVLTYSYSPESNFTGQVIVTSDGDTVYDSGPFFLDEGWATQTVQFISGGTSTSVIELYNLGEATSTFLYDAISVKEIIGGDFIANGDITGKNIQVNSVAGYKSSDGSTGKTGSFTTVDLKTVTVKDGIITSIV